MSLKHILLGMLREPASGYDLRRQFDQGARHFWSANLNQIYPTLERMELGKWLRSKKEPSLSGPPKRIYTRTATGKRELLKWVHADPIMGKERFAYLGQLIFMGELDDLDRTEKFFQLLRSMLSETLELLKAPNVPLTQAFDADPTCLPTTTFHEFLAIRMGVRAIGAKVDWCEECLEMIQLRRTKGKSNA
jgi:PadR family transcriptional regulator, regulatory protein AphA